MIFFFDFDVFIDDLVGKIRYKAEHENLMLFFLTFSLENSQLYLINIELYTLEIHNVPPFISNLVGNLMTFI